MRFVITDNKRVGDLGTVYVANKIREFNPTAERKFVLGYLQVVHHFKCIKD